MNSTQVAELLARAKAKPAPKPCTEHTQRCADARDHRLELRPCCREHLITIMSRVAAALNDAGVVWWADYGTLMGAVRNPLTTWADYHWLPQEDRPAGPLAPGILPHDKDGDLGCAWRSIDAVRRQMAGIPAHAFRDSLKFELSARNRTNVDLFFWLERADGTFYREKYAAVDDYKGREFHRDLLFPLTTVEWEGLTLPAPRDPAAFLEMRYGPDWRTPIPANNDGVRR